MIKVKEHYKRYLVSIGLTFLAGFAVAVIPDIDSLTLQSFKNGGLAGLLFAGIRTGVKFVLEAFLGWYNQR